MPPAPSLFTSPAGQRRVMELYDRMLARWPVDHERLEIPTRHGTTFIIAAGSTTAEPLILLHGAGSNSLMWIDDFALYSRHFRVYAVDLIGEAGKSAAARPEQIDRLVLICPGGITPDRMSFILYALTLRAIGTWGIGGCFSASSRSRNRYWQR
jgi:hypothetical protein